MKKIIPYAIEAYHHSKKSILGFITFLVAIWGMFNFFLSQKLGWYVLSMLAIFGFIFAFMKYSFWFYHIVKGRMTVPVFGKRETTLLRNDFQKNMDLMLHDLSSDELEKFAFIMGIDRTGKLDISSTGGVVYSVLKYLNTNYMCEEQCPVDFIQQVIDKKMETLLAKGKEHDLDYGVCIEVKMKLQSIHNTESISIIPCNLILIANSRKEDPKDKNLEERMTDDNQSNIIVPKVFDYLLKTNWYGGAMIGVMGTNGMGQSYQVIFSQIINQFARICYKDKHCPLYHLYISIREADYSRSDMSLSHLEKYVRQCAEYYSTWNSNTTL